jgi:methionyl-tRNA formyltransferase
LLAISRPAAGRDRAASPIQQAAESLGIAVWTPQTVNAPDVQSRISQLGADLLVVCDYGEILRPETLATTRLGGINLHGSLLPKYRGAAPVQWAILRGETETGNSIIQMTPGLDAGPILAQQKTPIDPDETAEELEARLAEMGATLVGCILDEVEMGSAKPIVQEAGRASKAPRLKKEQGAIDWSRSANEIKNQVRALRPWPRAFTFWRDAPHEPLRLNIDRVTVVNVAEVECGMSYRTPQSPGTILKNSRTLVIATGDSAVQVLNLQPAGKRAMSAEDFLRGYRPHLGGQFASV